MRRKTRNSILLALIFFTVSIGIAFLSLYLGDMGGKGGVIASYFTKEDMLNDYEYLWKKIEENWPYFYAAKEYNIDLDKIKDKYKNKILSKLSDVNFYNLISDMLDELSSYKELGKIYALDLYRQAYMEVEPRYKFNSRLVVLLNKKDTIQKYRYINTLLKIKPIGMYSVYELYGTNSKNEAQINFDKNIQVEIIEENKIAKIKINSMFINEYNSVEKSIYEEGFRRIYKNLSNYEHIIFDLTDCVGTNSYLWKRYIVMPNIEDAIQYDITCIYKATKDNIDYYKSYFDIVQKPISEIQDSVKLSYINNYDSYFNHTVKIISNLSYHNVINAKKWIITSKNTGLEANNFVNFAKETEFATVIGANLGRLDVPVSVGAIKLPKSGLVIIYDGLLYVDKNGNQLDIKADIEAPDDGNALEICLNEIRRLMANGEERPLESKPVSSNATLDINEYNKRLNEFNKFVGKVNGIRKELALAEPLDYIIDERYTPSFKDEKNVFSTEEINSIMSKENTKSVTKLQAIQDVETLFKLYKYSYAGYYYFGGDVTYNAAKEKIIKDIEQYDKEVISGEELIELIVPHLRFVQDGHNSIRVIENGVIKKSDIEFCENYYLFISNEYDISYKNNKYYLKLDDKEILIESFSGDNNLDSYIKPTIDDEGKLSYGLFALFTSFKNAEKCNTIIVVDNDKKVSYELNWKLANNASRDYMNIYERKEIDGIPTYFIHRMRGLNYENPILEKFPLSAIGARDEKVFIIDLRGNNGGYSYYANEWYFNYTGKIAKSPRYSFTKFSMLDAYMYTNKYNVDFPNFTDKYYDSLEWVKESNKSRIWADNDNIIIVLIDNNVASAGEIMIEHLSTIDNVIFVGSNTYGARLTSGISSKYLPNSKLEVYYGFAMHFFDNPEGIEGKGYMPDIWVNPEEALDKAIKFCKYYNLNKDN